MNGADSRAVRRTWAALPGLGTRTPTAAAAALTVLVQIIFLALRFLKILLEIGFWEFHGTDFGN